MARSISYQYRGYSIIKSESGWWIRDRHGNPVRTTFPTDTEAEEYIDDMML